MRDRYSPEMDPEGQAVQKLYQEPSGVRSSRFTRICSEGSRGTPEQKIRRNGSFPRAGR
ncbi:MAG TPA: hypothetical protein VMV49_14965 [Candidatus Deferrimicrobium sp.]|nr:hypothetical protein [Candidatus Deferrimicrobium sp.]